MGGDQQIGRKPSDDDEFYVQWGRESLKNNITLANDILKQLISISSAILGLTIIFEKIVVTELLRTLSLLSIFISLIIAFVGLLPYESKVQPYSPKDISDHKKKALKHKRSYLWVSAAFLNIGFGLLIGQFIIKLL
jgi:hypothetical protein